MDKNTDNKKNWSTLRGWERSTPINHQPQKTGMNVEKKKSWQSKGQDRRVRKEHGGRKPQIPPLLLVAKKKRPI